MKLKIKVGCEVTLLEMAHVCMFACNQYIKLAQFNVLIHVSSSIKHTVWLCWRDKCYLSVLFPL